MNVEYEARVDEVITKRYRDLERRVMADIIRRIAKNSKITSTADWQINKYMDMGATTEEIRLLVEEAARKCGKDIDDLYQTVIDEDYVRNKAIYEAQGKEYIPYDENPVFQQIIDGYKQQTADSLVNLTNTEGVGFVVNRQFVPATQYIHDTMDQAVVDITSGQFDYNSVLKRTVQQMTSSGLRTVAYQSGATSRVDTHARRAVLTGLSQLTARINESNAQSLNTEYYEVEWHAGARTDGSHDITDHQWWQGKVYTMQQLRDVCGYGTVVGLMGANCYHTFYPFVMGISTRNWSDEWLEQENAKENTPRTYNGKEYTQYQATQHQRELELAARVTRDRIDLLKAGDADELTILEAKATYSNYLRKYEQFSDAMGIPTEKERIYLAGTKGQRYAITKKEQRRLDKAKHK